MAGRYNRPHPDRGQSHYPDRLRKRGVTNVDIRMEPLDVLRRRAVRRGQVAVPADPSWNEFYDDLEADSA